MNNFIIGQITPDLLESITYGTYILFGLLTLLGAAFIWFFVPETKRLTLEEMDTIFGSEGTALKEQERMQEINREIGLSAIYGGDARVSSDDNMVKGDEKGAVNV
jgi:hypothetical protein